MVVKEAETGGKGGEKISVSSMAAELNGMLGTKLGVEVEKEAEEEEEMGETKTETAITLDALKRDLLRLHPQPWLQVEINKM